MEGSLGIYDWSSFEELSPKPTGIDLGFSSWSFSNVVLHSQSRNILAVLSGLPGSFTPPSLGLWPSKILSPENHRAVAPLCQDSMAKDLKAIVGPYKSWVIFLNHNGWLCSINMDTAANDKCYIRHFYVPIQWHLTLGSAEITITPKGTIVMAVNREIAVFHNAIDFEEKIVISPWI